MFKQMKEDALDLIIIFGGLYVAYCIFRMVMG